MGGTYFTAKERAKFIICSHSTAKKILESRDHYLKHKILVSVKFLAALSFGHFKKEDYKHYQYTVDTKEDTKNCPCTIDPNHNGVKEYPVLLFAYYSELKRLFPNDEKKVDSLFQKFS